MFSSFSRLTLLLVALGAGGLPMLGAAQAQSLPSYSSVPVGQAAVVFRARTGRAGTVDVLVDGVPVLQKALVTDMFNTFNIPAGTHEVAIRTSYDGTTIISRTLSFQAGEVYAMSFENYLGYGDYRLRLWPGLSAAHELVNADW